MESSPESSMKIVALSATEREGSKVNTVEGWIRAPI